MKPLVSTQSIVVTALLISIITTTWNTASIVRSFDSSNGNHDEMATRLLSLDAHQPTFDAGDSAVSQSSNRRENSPTNHRVEANKERKQSSNPSTVSKEKAKTANYYNKEDQLLESLRPTQLEIGILSHQNVSFFRQLQQDIDTADPHEQCHRYGWTYRTDNDNDTISKLRPRRRLFLGALIASEPQELLEIVAAEVYGLYSGIVLVESNRTQNFVPRPFQRLSNNHTLWLAQLYGVPRERLQVRPYSNENRKIRLLTREHRQRQEIVRGWKALGMQPDDVGVLADADETLTRDFLRALQICTNVPQLDYKRHYCHHSLVKITAFTRIFEASPECLTENRAWFHPDVIVGQCIDGIGHKALHPRAPRSVNGSSFLRARGFGSACNDWDGEAALNVSNGPASQTPPRYPLWDAADFRRTCSGPQVTVVNTTLPRYMTATASNESSRRRNGSNRDSAAALNDDTAGSQLERYTGFPFHNFFAHVHSTRFKYLTYGHADKDAGRKFIGNLSQDLQMMVRCVLPDDVGTPESEQQDADLRWRHEGYESARPFLPIYFHDADYRRRRHAHVRAMVQADQEFMQQQRRNNPGANSPLSSSHRDATAMRPSSTAQPNESVRDVSPHRPYQNDGDSSTASVIALATNYDIRTYKRFVGSLRRSGYTGHIMLGLAPNPSRHIVHYLHSRNVTIHALSWVNCTYTRDASMPEDIFQKTKCASPYPDIKIRWSRFPLARDWLRACSACTGPVLITDARDVIFQRDPFGPGSQAVDSLQVFEEHADMTTDNWLTEWPIRECKSLSLPRQPMLCSGTTIGPRAVMLEYLELMYREMKVWIEDPKCRFNINGDDQSIHNYLYYTDQLPVGTRSMPHRQGGIVNTIGHYAAQLFRQHIRPLVDQAAARNGTTKGIRYPGATQASWIGLEYGLTNEHGLLIESDGSVSRVVHQWDRFGTPYLDWLQEQDWVRDTGSIPGVPDPHQNAGGVQQLQ
jgi:Glycosyltransferase family 17